MVFKHIVLISLLWMLGIGFARVHPVMAEAAKRAETIGSVETSGSLAANTGARVDKAPELASPSVSVPSAPPPASSSSLATSSSETSALRTPPKESSHSFAAGTVVNTADTAAASQEPQEDKAIVHRAVSALSGQSGGAAGNGNENGDVKRRGNNSKYSSLMDLWPLLVVLVVIGGAALLIKKYMPKSRSIFGGSDVLRIVARTPVGTKQQLVLVKLGRRLVLLGVTPERINALNTIDDPNQVAMLMGEAASAQPTSMTQTFAAAMNRESAVFGENQESAAVFDELIDDEDTSAGIHSDDTHGDDIPSDVRGLLSKVRQLAHRTNSGMTLQV